MIFLHQNPGAFRGGGKGQFAPGPRLHHKQNRNRKQVPLHWGRGETKIFAFGPKIDWVAQLDLNQCALIILYFAFTLSSAS